MEGHRIRSQHVFLFLAALITAATLYIPTAQADWKARAQVTSRYIYRGVLQAAEEPAYQAGLDYHYKRGWYAGAWASKVQGNHDGDLETNYYLGRLLQINNIFLDAGYLYYHFHHNVPDDNRQELYLIATTGRWQLSLHNDITDSPGLHAQLNATFALPYEMGLTTAIGRQFFDDRGEDYTYYRMEISRNLWRGVLLGIGATTTTSAPEDESYGFGFIRVDIE